MNSKDLLDSVVKRLRLISVRLSGADSPLRNPWEEIKEQIQHEASYEWPLYLATIQSIIAAEIESLSADQFNELLGLLKCIDRPSMERKLLQRLLLRGRKETINYRPFNFSFFCYPLLHFTVYGRVLKRTGLYTLRIRAYSIAAPMGEEGDINTMTIDEILSAEDFEAARGAGWPEKWRDHS